MNPLNDLKSCAVIILAAGQGKRMRSPLPKVLHEIGGKPLLYHVLAQVCAALPLAPIAIVVGHGRQEVESFIRGEPIFRNLKITFIVQTEQKGTGHAARCAMDSDWGQLQVQMKNTVLVLPGDLPLISTSLIQGMALPLTHGQVLRLLTCELLDPTGYGRVVRGGKGGSVLRIVEEKDASEKEKKIREVAVSIYLFQAEFLKNSLHGLSDQNAQGEYYLTDLIGDASQKISKQKSRQMSKIAVTEWKNPEDLRGVNDLWELMEADQRLNDRLVRGWALRGVRFMDARTTRIEALVQLSEEVVVHAGAILMGLTRVGKGAILGPRVVLKDVEVGPKAHLKTGTVAEQSQIEANAQVGPYAHLRPGSVVGAHAKIGNFVELKKAKVGEHTNIAHLSYVGDAEIGRNVNIGCGFVTCNFDGRMIDGERKHRTLIEDDVFLGSDCQTVAPIRIGQGAYVASGSTITEDVPSGALAIARSRQTNKLGYAQKLKQRLSQSKEK